MITKKIIWFYSKVQNYLSHFSTKTKKETLRFILAFSIAWIIKTLINEFPIFSQYFSLSNLDYFVQNILIKQTYFILSLLGYEVFYEGIFIQIIGTVGIRYEISCLAFRHLTLFIVFILVYYGKLIHKLWYLILGSVVIMFVNALRGSIICIAQIYSPEKSITIHDIISPFFMYMSILVLWILWANYFGKYTPKLKKLKN